MNERSEATSEPERDSNPRRNSLRSTRVHIDPREVFNSARGSVQITIGKIQKALGTLDSRDSLRSSVALLPVVLAPSGFVERASPVQSARIRLVARQKWTGSPVLI